MHSAHRSVPRGIARNGPIILSYGFRPLFLGAGLFALVAMLGWIGALTLGWDIGGSYGMLNWHAHEMLFGYVTAALGGFMLTAIPNWTGRLPVSGAPLLALATLWLLGRVLMAFPDLLGLPASLTLDALFLPLLAAVAGREVAAGKNWKNLKILAGLGALSIANIGFHALVVLTASGADAVRPTVSIYLMLIGLIGGRIIPSFTRNWLVKAGITRLPKPFALFDKIALGALAVALVAWSAGPGGWLTSALAWLAALFHGYRLFRWRGIAVLDEPLLLAMHAAYGFIPLGLVGVGLSTLGIISAPSALHVFVVGAIGGMTLAIMMRASLAHTGRAPEANATRAITLLAIALAAIVRPFAEVLPDFYHPILATAASLWCLSFGLFCIEFSPILTGRPDRKSDRKKT